jgi:hypothetical protein
MGVANPNNRHNPNSPQQMQQMSFDPEFEVNTVELLSYNPIAQSLERVSAFQGNASKVFSYTDGQLTRIVKTIGSTNYTKDFTWTDGNLTGISSWS